MGSFEDEGLMDWMAKNELEDPLPQKQLPDRTIYKSRNEYGQPRHGKGLRWALPTIVDFNHAIYGAGPHYGPIQAEPYRAPEVVLDAGWSYSVDIWSLAILVCLVYVRKTRTPADFASSGTLFSRIHSSMKLAPSMMMHHISRTCGL